MLVHLALILAQIFLASLAIVGKLVFPQVPPPALVLFRVAGAASLLLLAAMVWGAERIRDRGDLLRLAGLAILGVSANQTLFLTGLRHTTAINASILVTTIPVFTVLLSVLLKRETASGPKVAGILLSGAGAVYLIGPEHLSLTAGTALGNMLILTGMVAYSAYLALSKPMLARYRSLTVTTYVMVLGVPGVLPLGISGLRKTDLPGVSGVTWLGVLYIILVPTILAYFLNIWALRRASSHLVAGYIYLQPLVVASIAPLILTGEHLTTRAIVAGAAIFAGLALVTWSERREATEVTISPP